MARIGEALFFTAQNGVYPTGGSVSGFNYTLSYQVTSKAARKAVMHVNWSGMAPQRWRRGTGGTGEVVAATVKVERDRSWWSEGAEQVGDRDGVKDGAGGGVGGGCRGGARW